ncbi:reverse transcriptase domain-containing protein [Citrus sinensis]|uniref:Reverse transcriptase domain-containing protein n=1 Tax=Citrus sinensis TaxID=2711 RepID=A0ACB8LF11_CITSI|nr:reverse transcriptase domain-containing protein [Citrus sinensis]
MAFHLYDKRVLRKIGQLVGNVIKINYRTELRERGKFARIDIRVSLTQPLVSRFNLDGRIQKVEYEGLPIICYQCGKYGHSSTFCLNKQTSNEINKVNSENNPQANVTVEKIGVPTVDNSSRERFGPWMVVERKGRARTVVDKENITDLERNQRTNFNTTSRFAALSDDHDAPTAEELDAQNPLQVPPQQPITSITDHFNTRKNPTLKTSRTLKPHHQLSKGKQVAKPQFPKPKPLHSTASSSMHETLRPHVTKILSHTINDPNPRHMPSDTVEFTFNLTTLDPTKHTAVTLPFKNQAARQPPISILFWNFQGAGSPNFRRTFAALVKNYNPKIVAIFEPRVSGKKADDFIKKSGFDRSHRVEANGFSGGIWVLWRDFFDVEVTLNHNQFIHLKISAQNVTQAWVTAVYASPKSSRRHELWHQLNYIASSMHDPWLVGGDFNSILYAEEKRGGSQLGTGICPIFNNWFYTNQMVDLPFSGPRFTWVRGSLSKRLDRVLSNKDWIFKFDNYSVTNLPRIDSDHKPVLVRFERNGRGMGRIKPFRFLAAWMTDNRFGNFMQDNWQGNMPYAQAASRFTSKVTTWNREVFGNIFKRKNELLARLGGVQKALENRPLGSLYRLEMKLKKKLEEVLSQDELLWYQKSRREWIKYGDRNTSFFNQKTITRRARNRITAIKDEGGNWIYEAQEIKDHAVTFFSTLYKSEQDTYQPYQVQGCFPQTDQTRLASLAMPIDKEEIHTAICQMSPLKAPGIDGYPAGFYQAQWHIVGESFSSGIKEVFNSHSIPGEVSKTLIVLIPKTERPTSFRMYRPIGLCIVFYKTVTKIIVTRLQALLPDLVGPHQTSFIPGRHITENIIIAQEVVHYMRRKLGKKGLMAIKIDLEKAYDRLNWNFIHETLMELALPFDLVHLIMECITSTRMNILWNGELTGDFSPSRGTESWNLSLHPTGAMETNSLSSYGYSSKPFIFY